MGTDIVYFMHATTMNQGINMEPPVKELNQQIKTLIANLNILSDMEIAILCTQDEIKHLDTIVQAYKERLAQVREKKNALAMTYREIDIDPIKGSMALDKLYCELNARWPAIEPDEWFIPPLEPPKQTSTARMPLVITKSSMSVSLLLRKGFRHATMRYHYLPKLSRNAALDKISSLTQELRNQAPKRDTLIANLQELNLHEQELKQRIAALQMESKREEEVNFSLEEYDGYKMTARNYFMEKRSPMHMDYSTEDTVEIIPSPVATLDEMWEQNGKCTDNSPWDEKIKRNQASKRHLNNTKRPNVFRPPLH